MGKESFACIEKRKQKKLYIEKRKLKKKSEQDKLFKKLDVLKAVNKLEKLELRSHPLIDIAVPGSILENAQSQILKTYLIGQIARAATIFKINSIVIYNENQVDERTLANSDEILFGKASLEMAFVLQYLECPQYLRKALFPHHPALQYVGLLNPLDSPHHLRVHEDPSFCVYREGIVIDKFRAKQSNIFPTTPPHNSTNISRSLALPLSTLVDIGLYKPVRIIDSVPLPIGTRVTLRLLQDNNNDSPDKTSKNSKRKYKGYIVSPNEPYIKGSLYWGYKVRLASSLAHVITECPQSGGYDLKIGTSDKGADIYEMINTFHSNPSGLPANSFTKFSNFKNCLVVFGGLRGLENIYERDADSFRNLFSHQYETKGERVQTNFNGDISQIFDAYLNTCPNQGSRTIRTEEAILITLSVLSPFLRNLVKA